MKIGQTTLCKTVSYTGKGLHSGLDVTMVMKPAPANTGIVFSRTDLPGNPTVKAHIMNVTNTMRATTLESGAAKVMTVEHILSALYSIGIDNCFVEMNSVEPPIADGSGQVFVEMILDAGIAEQEAQREIYAVKKQHIVADGDKFIAVLPYDGLRITFTSINKHPLLGVQFVDYEITPESYQACISKARTIAFTEEIEQLRALGLAKGGDIHNVIVYDKESCLSELRFPDELVRHKVLDVLGDISLTGYIKGHIIAVKSGHKLNTDLAHLIYKEKCEEALS